MLDVPGECHIEVSGKDLTQLANEPGGHRLQRIPPTERKGRVHTSTVTVAVLFEDESSTEYDLTHPSNFKIEWYSGTGAGGQHRNKHQNSARITHIPTGIVETAQCRSRENSKDEAMSRLLERLSRMSNSHNCREASVLRKSQMGSGQRGDKVRTYRFQDDIATNHLNGKKTKLSKIMDGQFELLW